MWPRLTLGITVVSLASVANAQPTNEVPQPVAKPVPPPAVPETPPGPAAATPAPAPAAAPAPAPTPGPAPAPAATPAPAQAYPQQPQAYPQQSQAYPQQPQAYPQQPNVVRTNTIFVQGGPSLLIPMGDFENAAEPSGGVSAVVGYRVTETLALIGALDYSAIVKKSGLSSNLDFSTTLVGAGLRVVPMREGNLRPYAQGIIGIHSTRLAISNMVDSESALGVKLGIGALYPLGNTLSIGSQVSYSHGAYEEATVSGVMLDANLSVSF